VTPDVAVLRSLAAVSEAFIALAGRLRARPEFRSVQRSGWLRAEEQLGPDRFRVGDGDGFRFEFYAEADAADDRTLVFALEAAWHAGEWTVDAAIRATSVDGDEVLVELPRRHARTGEAVAAELSGQLRMLRDREEEGLRRFAAG
jgi:hypothetical protein